MKAADRSEGYMKDEICQLIGVRGTAVYERLNIPRSRHRGVSEVNTYR